MFEVDLDCEAKVDNLYCLQVIDIVNHHVRRFDVTVNIVKGVDVLEAFQNSSDNLGAFILTQRLLSLLDL